MRNASVASTASGGRPPRTRQAIPTSIAPAPMVTPATEDHAIVPTASTATTGTAASTPDCTDTAARSKRAACCTATASDPRSGAGTRELRAGEPARAEGDLGVRRGPGVGLARLAGLVLHARAVAQRHLRAGIDHIAVAAGADGQERARAVAGA